MDAGDLRGLRTLKVLAGRSPWTRPSGRARGPRPRATPATGLAVARRAERLAVNVIARAALIARPPAGVKVALSR